MWSRLVFSLRNPFLSKGLLQVLAQVRDRQVWGKLISYDNGRESSIREHLNMNVVKMKTWVNSPGGPEAGSWNNLQSISETRQGILIFIPIFQIVTK